MTEELECSELGTQEYWNSRYKSEIRNFRSHGDVGEVWFGEDIVDRIIRWMEGSSRVSKKQSIVDIGCGNGMLLIELSNIGYENLLGLDYSEEAILLAREIAEKHNCKIKYSVDDILKQDLEQNVFDVIHDKGTYDAISLSENARDNRNAYIDNVCSYLRGNGLLIITSCNWTQDELLDQFKHKFSLLHVIPTPQFKFGGKVGSVVSSIVLEKQLL